MTSKRVIEHSANLPETRYDDLTVIKGIKESRQRWLRETLNIKTFADLAARSIDDILLQLPEGQIISRVQIESWIRQARHLSTVSQPKTQLPKRESGWHPFASFVIEFQQHDDRPDEHRTTIHYMEADKGCIWSGNEIEALPRWIAKQLGANTQVEFSPELQRTVAKAQIMPVPSKPSPLQPASETGFSEKLQEAILKTQLAPRHTAAVQTPKLKTAQISETGFSEPLQGLINRTRRTTAK